MTALPVPSTGEVATSPSLAVATAPLANELAGATVDVVAVLVPAVVPVPVLADADGLAVAPRADWLRLVLCDPPLTAITAPRATPNATGMAIGMAIFITRVLLFLRNVIHLHVRCDAPVELR